MQEYRPPDATHEIYLASYYQPSRLIPGKLILFGPVLQGQTDVDEDRLSSSWVC